jgi:predicted nuclease of predicted toxin-antitoxin system
MRFLLDQDVYANVVRLLSDLGHDVVTARQIGCAQSSDQELLATAHALDRVLVTRDRDFGSLVFTRRLRAGVIYLRLLPADQDSVYQELGIVLGSYSEEVLKEAFVVVEPGRHRIRRATTREIT